MFEAFDLQTKARLKDRAAFLPLGMIHLIKITGVQLLPVGHQDVPEKVKNFLEEEARGRPDGLNSSVYFSDDATLPITIVISRLSGLNHELIHLAQDHADSRANQAMLVETAFEGDRLVSEVSNTLAMSSPERQAPLRGFIEMANAISQSAYDKMLAARLDPSMVENLEEDLVNLLNQRVQFAPEVLDAASRLFGMEHVTNASIWASLTARGLVRNGLNNARLPVCDEVVAYRFENQLGRIDCLVTSALKNPSLSQARMFKKPVANNTHKIQGSFC